VVGITQNASSVVVQTKQQRFEAQQVICCGGLQADRLARLDGLNPGIKIVPFRGDYYDLTPSAAKKVRNLVYPVPNPAFPFLGVHFTRMVHGGVECGPNAVFSFEREGYSKTAFKWSDASDALSFPGTWRLFAQHWRHGLGEYQRAFSKRHFLAALRHLIPSLEMEDIAPARSGVRAQALDRSGALVDDFVIERNGRCVHVLNAPSPAATACLAVADTILRKEGATEFRGGTELHGEKI
jgi:L-2-hydroxyglutarate oxidase